MITKIFAHDYPVENSQDLASEIIANFTAYEIECLVDSCWSNKETPKNIQDFLYNRNFNWIEVKDILIEWGEFY